MGQKVEILRSIIFEIGRRLGRLLPKELSIGGVELCGHWTRWIRCLFIILGAFHQCNKDVLEC